MMLKHHLKYSLCTIFLILIVFTIGPASAAWWDSDWDSLSTVTLNASAPENNYQIHLSSDDFSIPVKMWTNMNQDGNDTRILHIDNVTEFSFWIEHLTAADDFSIWVNITDNTTGTTLNWYYGNSSVSSVSDIDSVMIFGDDFNSAINTSKWDNTDGYSQDNGAVYVSESAKYLKSNNDVAIRDTIIEYKMKMISPAFPYVAGVLSAVQPTTTLYYASDIRTDGVYGLRLFKDVAGNPYVDGAPLSVNADYHKYTLKYAGNTDIYFYIDDGNVKTISNNAYTTGNIWLEAYSGTGTNYFDYIYVRKYNATEPIIIDIDLTVFTNSIPSAPVVISPVNNSIFTSNVSVPLNVSSTDADGDILTYYFYGDTSYGSTFLGTNDTVNMSMYNWSVSDYDIYYWKAIAYDGFDFSPESDPFQFTYLRPPNLTYPANTSTIYTSYPPLTYDVSFVWEDTMAPTYKFIVSEDEFFNIITEDIDVSTNSKTSTLIAGKDYWWKVYANDGAGAYSDTSDIYTFTLTGNSTLTGSAIEGVVYQSNGDISAISRAEVTIWNATWSSSMITGSNGYYVFEDLNTGTVYNLQAKSDRYWDSSIALVSAEDNPVINNFYLIDDLTDTEWWHYVEFTLRNVWGVTYPDIATNVYIGDSVTVYESGITGTDGTITFHLDQNVEYYITFINTTLGINEDITLYPVAISYTVYIDSYSFALPDTVTDDIQAHITNTRINATHGYINFTWLDKSALTTSISYYISDVDGNELYSTNNSGPDMFDSQIVTATDDRYIVRYIGLHPTHDIIDQTETIVFHGGRRVDFGWDSDWQYAVTALAFLIFIGALFGAKTAQYGAIAVVMFAWIFKWIGWLDETNTSTLLIILAAVIAFGWSLRKSEEVKM